MRDTAAAGKLLTIRCRVVSFDAVAGQSGRQAPTAAAMHAGVTPYNGDMERLWAHDVTM